MADSSSKEEISRLKTKLKKANANHEEMVALWAQQGAEAQEELEETKQLLSKTKQELSSVKKQLRKHETRKDDEEPIVDSLKKQLEKCETTNNMKLEEMALEISELKDELRHTLSAKNDISEQLKTQQEEIDKMEKEVGKLRDLLKEKESSIAQLRDKNKELELCLKNDKKSRQTLEKEKSKQSIEMEKLNNKYNQSLKQNEEFELILSDLKTKVCEFEDELRNTKGTLADQQLEFKISTRRSTQQSKELREQLRKEAKAREQAEATACRLERSLLLQAEAMLEQQFQHDGRSDSPFVSSPAPPNMKEIKDLHYERSGKSEKEELWKQWDAAASMSPLTEQTIPTPQKVERDTSSFTTPISSKSITSSLTGKETEKQPPLTIKNTKEKDLCAELARRLETLLAENAQIRARVKFLEDEVRDLNEDLDNRRLLVKQLLKQPISAKLDMDKRAVEDRVKSLVSAVTAIANQSNNIQTFGQSNGFTLGPFLESTLKTTDTSNRKGGENNTSILRRSEGSAPSSENGSGESTRVSSNNQSSLAPFSFALSPQESLLQITLRENIELKLKLAVFEPPQPNDVQEKSARDPGVSDTPNRSVSSGITSSIANLNTQFNNSVSSSPFAKEVVSLFSKIKEKASDVATATAATQDDTSLNMTS